MATDTKIEWATKTWNPVRGCSRVSEGCRNCYAENIANRFSGVGQPYEGLAKDGKWTGEVRAIPTLLQEPFRWKKPQRIFVNSMSDLFHGQVPFAFVDKVMAVIALSPRHIFQVLTKRPKRMMEYFSANDTKLYDRILAAGHEFRYTRPELMGIPISNPVRFPLKNLWLGVSCEDQRALNERVTPLIHTPAAVRFLSLEPLLGAIHITSIHCIDWVIAGCESGRSARPMEERWVRSIKDQCEKANVPFFFKQAMGSDKRKISLPVLDGQSWAQFPVVK